MSSQRSVILYHRTDAEKAQAIISAGFSDSSGYFLNTRTWTGVWLSASPSVNDKAMGDIVLKVKLQMSDDQLARWEWTSEGQKVREWLIPANIVNKNATIELSDRVDYSTVAA